MDSTRSTQIKVGIFLTVGLVFILGSIFFLGADKALFTSYLRVHAHFDQVQGLSVGSVVSLSGVTVGNVESITFLSEQNTLDVTLKVNKDFAQRLRKGSQVEIRTQGALGDKFVFIIPGDLKAEQVKDGEVLEVAKATDLFGIVSERGSETSKVFDIINDLHKLTASLNHDNKILKIMSHMEAASKETHKLVAKLNANQTGEKLEKSVEKLDSVLTKIDKGQGTLGALINDPSLHQQLKALIGGSTRKDHVKSLLRTSIEKEEK